MIQETLVKHKDRNEYLGMLGFWGTVFAACQISFMETKVLWNLPWSGENIGFIIGFVVCINLMYTRASTYLRNNDAALLNLSLLTSDVYAVIFSLIAYGYLVPWLYFVAFSLAFIGLVIYSTSGPATITSSLPSDHLLLPADKRSSDLLITEAAVPALFYHSLPQEVEEFNSDMGISTVNR